MTIKNNIEIRERRFHHGNSPLTRYLFVFV